MSLCPSTSTIWQNQSAAGCQVKAPLKLRPQIARLILINPVRAEGQTPSCHALEGVERLAVSMQLKMGSARVPRAVLGVSPRTSSARTAHFLVNHSHVRIGSARRRPEACETHALPIL